MADRNLFPITSPPPDFPQTTKQLRWNVYRGSYKNSPNYNGFDKCVRRIGRRIYIDEAEYFKWVDEQNGVNTG